MDPALYERSDDAINPPTAIRSATHHADRAESRAVSSDSNQADPQGLPKYFRNLYTMACRPSRGFSALHQAKTVLAPEAFLDEGTRRTATEGPGLSNQSNVCTFQPELAVTD